MSDEPNFEDLLGVLQRHSKAANGLLKTEVGQRALFDFLYSEARLRVSIDDFQDAVETAEGEDGARERFRDLLNRPLGERDQGSDHGKIKEWFKNIGKTKWRDTVFSKLNGIIKKIAGGGD